MSFLLCFQAYLQLIFRLRELLDIRIEIFKLLHPIFLLNDKLVKLCLPESLCPLYHAVVWKYWISFLNLCYWRNVVVVKRAVYTVESFNIHVKDSRVWWARRLSMLFHNFMSSWFRASILRLVHVFLFFFNLGSYLLEGIWIRSLKLLGLAALWRRGFNLARDALKL